MENQVTKSVKNEEVGNKLETTKKMTSRKFIVWIVWLVLSVLLVAFCITITFITKSSSDNSISLLEKILGYFFAISMMYLGMNVGQKVGLSFAEKPSEKTEDEK